MKYQSPYVYREHTAFRRNGYWVAHLSYGVRASGDGHYHYRSLAQFRRDVDSWWDFVRQWRRGEAKVDDYHASLLILRLGSVPTSPEEK